MILESFIALAIGASNGNFTSNNPPAIVTGDSLAQRDEIQRREVERVREATERRNKALQKTRTTSTSQNSGNGYSYGYCTWYVAQEKGITERWGNARDWPVNSQTPKVGAIVVTYESRLGHVGLVTKVDETMVTIREMNYIGYNRVSTRTVDYRTLPLKGFLII
jgi:surface antigen